PIPRLRPSTLSPYTPLFRSIRLEADPPHRGVQALEKAGHPVVTLTLREKLDLGGEFFRWEVATAIAGAILGIDAFDQPNVQESRSEEHTSELQSRDHLVCRL